MKSLLSSEDGETLVRLARESAKAYLETGRSFGESGLAKRIGGGALEENRGAFVTVQAYPQHELRGCIGFISPGKPLSKSISELAMHACVHDSRFKPVDLGELENIVFSLVASIKRDL